MPAEEGIKIIERCHSSPYGGHYGAFRTHGKIWQCGFFSSTMCIMFGSSRIVVLTTEEKYS